jgi:two-component system, chemotaxis family, protein-glutamate methylesterase/glutaminase
MKQGRMDGAVPEGRGLVVVGVSAGGLEALKLLLGGLSADFPLPVVIVQHRGNNSDTLLAGILSKWSGLPVSEAEDKEPPLAGHAYLAPANYHLLIETDGCFSLTIDDPELFSRPSINALFLTAADFWGSRLIAVVLTGANGDGSLGAQRVKAMGGRVLVQDPLEAEYPVMPSAAIAAIGVGSVDFIAPLSEIPGILMRLAPKAASRPEADVPEGDDG